VAIGQRPSPWPLQAPHSDGQLDGWQVARLEIKAPSSFLRMIVAAGARRHCAVFKCPNRGFFYTIEELLKGVPPVVSSGLVTKLLGRHWADLLGLAAGTDGQRLEPAAAWELSASVLPVQSGAADRSVVLFGFGGLVLAAEAYALRWCCNGYAANGRCHWRREWLHRRADRTGPTSLLARLLHSTSAGIRQVVVVRRRGHFPCLRDLCWCCSSAPVLAAAAGNPARTVRPMLTLGGALGLAADRSDRSKWAVRPPSSVGVCRHGPSWRPARAHRWTAMFPHLRLTKRIC